MFGLLQSDLAKLSGLHQMYKHETIMLYQMNQVNSFMVHSRIQLGVRL